MKASFFAFVTAIILGLTAAIVLPLYFLKWKKDSKSVVAGTVITTMNTVIQLELIDWTYFSLFYKAPFETDANGSAFIRRDSGTADSSYQLLTSVQKQYTNPVGYHPLLYEITNCLGSPNYNAAHETGNILLFFAKNIAVATESQVRNGITNLANTKSQGGYFLSDDGMSIKVGSINNGTLTLSKNVAPKSATAANMTSNIPNTWFVMGSSTLNIEDYMNRERFSGPTVTGVSTSDGATLKVTKPSVAITSTIPVTLSRTYFLLKIPIQFSQYLFSTADDLPGTSISSASFRLSRLTNSNALKSGWSILTIQEARSIIDASNTGGNRVCLVDEADATVKICEVGKLATDGKVTIRTTSVGYMNGVQNYWLIKASTAQSSFPLVSDILDFSVVIGRVVPPPPMVTGGFETPIIPSVSAPKSSIVKSTDPLTNVSTIVNHETGIIVTQTTSNDKVTSTNQSTGQVTVNKVGETPSDEVLTRAPPPKKSFFDENKLSIFIAIGVVCVLLISGATFWFFWRRRHDPEAIEKSSEAAPAVKSPEPAEKSPEPVAKSPEPAEKSPEPAEPAVKPADKSPEPADKAVKSPAVKPAVKSPEPAAKSP